MGRQTVTVIIPAYNSGKFIASALDSALVQTAPPDQIIVINDGSTDDTHARLLPYRGKIAVIDQPNQGAAAARNAGLQIAAGDFIAFLDADDGWHPRKLEMQLSALNRHPEIQLIGTDVFDYPGAGEPNILPEPRIEEIPLDRLLVRNYFTASSVMVRTEIVRRIGGFDPSVSNVEDYDYWQRVAQLGAVANLKSPLTGYRQVAGSVSRRPDGVENGLRQILRKRDKQNSWRGQSWLRRRAISHLHYSIAHLHAAAGCQLLSLWKMLLCVAWYPLPYRHSETGVTLGRPKRIIVLLLRLLRLKDAGSPLMTGGSVADA